MERGNGKSSFQICHAKSTRFLYQVPFKQAAIPIYSMTAPLVFELQRENQSFLQEMFMS
jgi:hypothetical protein